MEMREKGLAAARSARWPACRMENVPPKMTEEPARGCADWRASMTEDMRGIMTEGLKSKGEFATT